MEKEYEAKQECFEKNNITGLDDKNQLNSSKSKWFKLKPLDWNAISTFILTITFVVMALQTYYSGKNSYIENRAYIAIVEDAITPIEGGIQYRYQLLNSGKTIASEMASTIISSDIPENEVIKTIEGTKSLTPGASYTDYINLEEIIYKGKEMKLYIRYKDYHNKKHVQIITFTIPDNFNIDVLEHKENDL